MSGTLFLTYDDFFIGKCKAGNILCNNIKGFSLILFYSTQCGHCNILFPIFTSLTGTVGHCLFGLVNVSTNKKCIQLSKQTIAPITFVPYIVLYIEGVPFMRYNGPYVQDEIRRFVVEVADKVNKNQKFTKEVNNNVKKTRNGHEIPSYTIGIPLYGDDNDDYCEFALAYINSKK